MDKESLCRAAAEAAESAYAPYSGYAVGAAVLGESGDVHTGCNVENRSYGLSMCAERVAVFNALRAGEDEIKAVAVHTRDGATPCGACRQVMLEFAAPDAAVYAAGPGGIREYKLGDLLPQAFASKL